MNQQKLDLIKLKVEILKLKANEYVWACETPKEVKEELEVILTEITQELENIKNEAN